MIRAKASERAEIAKGFREIRAQVEQWFEVERPLEDPLDPASESPHTWKWIIEGERYPTYEQLSRWAIFDKSVARSVPVGVYAGLSAFSHPSFIAARELRVVNNGLPGYQYDFDYVERAIRLVLFGLGDSFKHWLGYYDHDHDRLVARYDEVVSDWDGLTTRTEPQPE